MEKRLYPLASVFFLLVCMLLQVPHYCADLSSSRKLSKTMVDTIESDFLSKGGRIDLVHRDFSN
eukprot:c44311_g1_i1 orf=2-190(-)